MNLSLTVAERFAVMKILNGAENLSHTDLRHVVRIADKIAVSEEEGKKIGMREEAGALRWNENGRPDAKFELSSEEHVFLKGLFKAQDGKFSPKQGDGKHTLSLMDKLNGEGRAEASVQSGAAPGGRGGA